jgi:RimK family alpha-L-glutamate ligase
MPIFRLKRKWKKWKKQKSLNNMQIALITTRYTLDENLRLKEEAESMGHEFKIFDCKQLEYGIVGDNLEIPKLKDLQADLIIVRGVFDSVKSIAIYIKSLQKKGVKVFDNNFLDHRYSINKVADILKLATAGIPIPDSYHLHSFEEYFKAADKIGYPVICKLTRTGKGARVFKIDNRDELTAWVKETEERGTEPKSYMIQKFIDYEHDLRILIIGERMFCMKRIPGVGEFRANFSLGGSVELFNLDEAGKEMAFEALHAVDLSVGGVDMLIGKDGSRTILEVNHTAGFVGMEQATGQNIGKIWLEHAIASAI